MSETSIACKEQAKVYLQEREWVRYLAGDVLYNICDVRMANTISSWLDEELSSLRREQIETWLSNVRRWLLLIDERRCDQINAAIYDELMAVQKQLFTIFRVLIHRWTECAMEWTGVSDRKNEIVHSDDAVMISFWQLSSERKNKMIFFPGIQVEVAPFLQSVHVVSYVVLYTEEIEQFFATAHAGYLYCFEHMDPKKPKKEDDNASLRSRKSINIAHSPRSRAPSIKVDTKRSSSHANSIKSKIKELSVNQRPPRTKSQGPRKSSKSKIPSKRKVKRKKSPKAVKTEEELKAAIMSETSNLWTQPPVNSDEAVQSNLAASHVIDLRSESFVGNVYEIRSFNTFSRKKQSGNWLLHTEKHMNPFELTGEILNVSLKVPVEEVFMGPVEPSMAFQEENGSTWKKGVFTTHTKFDQNTFVISTKLSKLGKIALFQTNDFHYPYRKWSIEFHETHVNFFLHSSTVALRFMLQSHTIMLETQTGDEFSKLRALHGKKLSLQDMAMQMMRHGVYVFPNEAIIKKHKGQVKDYELEIYVARHLCLHRLDAHASRMNSALPKKTILVNLPNKTLQVVKNGEYEISFGQDTGGGDVGGQKWAEAWAGNDAAVALSNLFRWMLLTRAISLTK